MLNQHTKSKSEVMMAIVWSLGNNDSAHHDETLQYLLILCSKVALNTFVLSFWRQSILKSLLGICSVSMYVADVLLVCAISNAWLFRENLPTSTSMCFILAHASTIYALLPLPIIIAGAFDYASYPNLDITCYSQRRAVCYCFIVALLWALALIYTFHNTNTQPIDINKDYLRVTVCRVHGSDVVFQLSIHVLTAVSLILLLHFKKLISWISRANELAKQTNPEFLPDQANNKAGECENLDIPESSPPLLVSLTLGFAINWLPYLLMCLACALVGFLVPAYASVNLLWMACTNSLMVGIAFWFRSESIGPFIKFPDDTCLWNIYWHLSNETETVDAKLPTTKLFMKAHKPSLPIQEV